MPATRTLERRRRLAGRRWRALHAGRTPVVYVGLGSCGLAAGAGEVLSAARAHLAARDVKARVVRSPVTASAPATSSRCWTCSCRGVPG